MATITSLGFSIFANWNGKGVTEARDDLMKLQAEMKAMSDTKLHLDIEADTAQARAEIAALREAAHDMQINIDVDRSAIAAAAQAIDDLTRDRVIDVTADTQRARNEIRELEEDVDDIDSTINVDADTLHARIKIAAAARNRRTMITVIANTTQAKERIDTIAAPRQTRMWVDVHNVSADIAEFRLDRIARRRRAEVDVDVDTRSAMSSLARLIGRLTQTAITGKTTGAIVSASMATIGISVGVAAASIAVLPPLITHVGVLLSSMLPLAFAAAATAALWSTDEVSKAWERFKDDAIDVMREAAEPMKTEIVYGLDLIRERLIGMSGPLKQAFGATAKLLHPLIDNIADMVESWLPGMAVALENMGPFMDGWGRGATKLGEHIGNMFRNMMNDAEGMGIFMDVWLTRLGEMFEIFGTKTSEMARGAADVIGGLYGGINSIIDGVLTGLTGAMAEASKPFGDFLQLVGDQLGGAMVTLGPPLGRLIAALSEALGPILEALTPALAILIGQFADSLIPVVNALAPVLFAIADGLATMLGWLEPIMPVLGPLIAGIWLFNAALAANPITLIVMGLVALTAGIVYLATRTQFFQTIWSAVWGFVKAVAVAVWDWLKGAWESTIGFLSMRWEQFTGTISGAWSAAWNWVKSAAETVWNGIKAGWDMFLQGLKQLWDTFSAPFKLAFEVWWFAVRAVVAIIWAWMEAVWNTLWNTIKATWDSFVGIFKPIWDSVWSWVSNFVADKWRWISDIWNNTWTWISDRWNSFSSWFSGVWNTAWTWVSDFVAGKWRWISDRWNDLWAWVSDRWNSFSSWFSGVWNTVWTWISDFVSGKWQWISDRWNSFWGAISDRWNSFSSWLSGVWQTFWNWISEFVGGVWDGIKNKWDGISDALTTAFNWMVEKARDIWNKIKEIFAKPVNFVIRIWNDHVAGKFGLPELTPIEGFATGGRVDGPGTATSDDIPARLSRGEHVWTAREVDAAGGHGNVEALRRNALNGAAHFASGGPVEWMIGQQQRVAPELTVTSSYRDSNDHHGAGKAVDFSNGYDTTPEMQRFAQWVADTWGRNTLELIHSPFNSNIKDGSNVGDGFGFYGAGTMNQHRNHVHWAVDRPLDDSEGGQSVLGRIFGAVRKGIAWTFERLTNPIINGIPDPFLPGVGSPFGEFPKSAAKKARDMFLDKVRGAEGASGGGDIGGVIPEGERLAIINEALRITNTPPPSSLEAWQRGMNTLITRESGWNAGAVNNWDSNAAAGNSSRGLAQVIPTTFEAHKAPGYNNINAPVDNVAASINYIKSRYGTIENVQQANANMPPKGYELGTNSAPKGWAFVGEAGPELVNFRGGEQVKSFDEIIGALKDSATGTAKELDSKVAAELRTTMNNLITVLTDENRNNRAQIEAEIRSLVERVGADVNASGQRFAQSVEQAIERVLAAAGMQLNLTMPVPQNAHDAAAYAQEVANQLLPQLEMMVRQRIGVR